MPIPLGTPGDAPERGRFSDHVGQVLLLCIGGIHQGMQTSNGVTDSVRASAAILSGDDKDTWHTDMMIFNSRAVGRLREAVGGVIAGIVTQGEGRNAPIDFEPLAPQWQEYAQTWANDHEGDLEQALSQVIASFRDFENRRTDKAPIRQSANPPPWATEPSAPPTPPPPGMPVGAPTPAGTPMPALPSQRLRESVAPTVGQPAPPQEMGF